MATLTYASLLKRNNIQHLTDRINGGVIQINDNNSPLLKCSGRVRVRVAGSATIIKTYDYDMMKMFIDTRSATDRLEIEANGVLYNLTKIYKDSVFSGKSFKPTVKEDIQLSSLQQQITEAVIKSGSDHIVVKCNGKKHKIIGAFKTPGTPKSDFHLIDISGKECVWISHKDGKTVKDFQQWGGVSKKEYPITPKEVDSFVTKIRSIFGNTLPSAMTVAMKITDKQLKNSAVYGMLYGKSLGRQNVTVLLQGDIKLINKSSHYELSSHITHYNGNEIKGDYEPVLMAIYKSDRNNFGIKGARFSISPIKSRTVKKWV